MNPNEPQQSAQKKPSRTKKGMVLTFSIALSVVALISFPLMQTTSKVGAMSREARMKRDAQSVIAHFKDENASISGKSEIQLVREVAVEFKLDWTDQEIESVAANLEIMEGKLQQREDSP